MTEEKGYDLGKSAEGIGKLVPILKDKRGNVIDGFHRQEQDPNWPTIIVESIDSDVKLELARLATNFCRRKFTEAEWNRILSFLMKSGMKIEDIAEQTGIAPSTIYYHLPQELKDQERSQATIKGIEEHRPPTLEVSSKTSDIARSVPTLEQTVKTSDTISNLVECDNCHMATHISKMKALDNKDLCPTCFERFSKMPKISRDQITEKHTVPVKETWEQRKAVMTPGISKMDEAVYQVLQNSKSLREAGWRFEFQKHYCIKEVISDVTAIKGDVEKPLFFDGDVHVGKEDRDEANRALLARRLNMPEVLAFAYSGVYSDVKRDEMASKIEKSLLEIVKVEA